MSMKLYPLRLRPGQDLKRELVAFAVRKGLQAGIIVTCVGSLRRAALRLADRPETTIYEAKYEILSLVGTLSLDGPHLHVALSDGDGRTIGGHLQDGSLIYTTAEIIVGELEQFTFTRPIDPETSFDELTIAAR